MSPSQGPDAEAMASATPERPASSGGGYRAVLRHPAIRRAAFGAFLGRLPTGVAALGIMLLVQDRTGTFRDAGIAVAAYSVATAASMPFVSRLIDRFGPRVLLLCAAINLGGLTSVVATSGSGDIRATLAACVLAGATQPSLTSAFRALCANRLTDPRTRMAAYSMDAIAIELTFIAGPPLAAAGAAAGRPELSLYGAGLATALGTSLFVSAAGSRAETGHARPRARHLFRERSLWLLMLTAALTASAIAFAEVSILARAVEAGAGAISGLILALWAAGSVVGGIVYGSRGWPGTSRQQLVLIMSAAAVLFLPLAAPGPLLMLAPAAVLAGISLAPAATITTAILGASVSPRAKTEAFGWMASAATLGGSLGYALAGAATDLLDERATVLSGALLAALAVPLALALPQLDHPQAAMATGTSDPR
ncbi:MFS transporter [Micromonospora sp. NPDC047465]|uniref:MFS transporter n=1 Tax=Micromonospora sp. NPDC047465 TaxID=3154813 RepID=UPI0033E8B455